MIEVPKAIYSYFSAEPHNDFYNDISGRLYFSEAPQGTARPYAVQHLISQEPEYFFGSERFEDFLVQFDLYDESQSAVNIGNYYNHMCKLFDHAAIAVTGFGTIKFERESSRFIRDPESNVWRYTVDYSIKLEKE